MSNRLVRSPEAPKMTMMHGSAGGSLMYGFAGTFDSIRASSDITLPPDGKRGADRTAGAPSGQGGDDARDGPSRRPHDSAASSGRAEKIDEINPAPFGLKRLQRSWSRLEALVQCFSATC
jgi:hypothetical protein